MEIYLFQHNQHTQVYMYKLNMTVALQNSIIFIEAASNSVYSFSCEGIPPEVKISRER